jgi:Tol biopolymer transport system component
MFILPKHLLATAVAASGILLSTGCAYDPYNKPSTPNAFNIGTPSYSGDNKRLLFTICDRNRLCTLATYDLQQRTLRRLKNTTHQDWLQPRYSPDNTRIVFVSEDRDGKNSQIAMIDAGGDNYSVVTKGEDKKSQPSFSPDGIRIIFLSHKKRTTYSGKTAESIDVFETDIAGKSQKQLTDFGFQLATNPFYMPDGKRFIVAGFGAEKLGVEGLIEYSKQYQMNNIFTMDLHGPNSLQPAFIHGPFSANATVSKNGEILFISETNELDGIVRGILNYDLFIKRDKVITRVTNIFSLIGDASISQDGTKVVFQADNRRSKEREFFIVNSDGSNLKRVPLPLPPEQENLANTSQSTLIPTPDKYQSRMANTAP